MSGGDVDDEYKKRGKDDDDKDDDGGGDDSDDCDKDVHIKGHDNYWRCFDVLPHIQEPFLWAVKEQRTQLRETARSWTWTTPCTSEDYLRTVLDSSFLQRFVCWHCLSTGSHPLVDTEAAAISRLINWSTAFDKQFFFFLLSWGFGQTKVSGWHHCEF